MFRRLQNLKRIQVLILMVMVSQTNISMQPGILYHQIYRN